MIKDKWNERLSDRLTSIGTGSKDWSPFKQYECKLRGEWLNDVNNSTRKLSGPITYR